MMKTTMTMIITIAVHLCTAQGQYIDKHYPGFNDSLYQNEKFEILSDSMINGHSILDIIQVSDSKKTLLFIRRTTNAEQNETNKIIIQEYLYTGKSDRKTLIEIPKSQPLDDRYIIRVKDKKTEYVYIFSSYPKKTIRIHGWDYAFSQDSTIIFTRTQGGDLNRHNLTNDQSSIISKLPKKMKFNFTTTSSFEKL